MEYENVIVMEKLKRLNKGFNFFNFEQTEKKYYINVELKVTQDLGKKTEVINVSNNLYIGGYSWKEYDVVDFLKDLETFCKKPLAEIRTTNRKEQVNSYSFREIEKVIRDKTIKFSDIKIDIGELASERLSQMKIDFIEQIKTILKTQKVASKEMQNKIDRYVILIEKIELLKTLIKKDSGYYYSSKPKDNTIKIIPTAEEYNSKLKEIEIELRKLEKYFGLSALRIDYIQIKEEMSYVDWLKKNEEVLRENYEQAQEESGDDESSFDEYCEVVFENGGLNEDDEEYEDEEIEEE